MADIRITPASSIIAFTSSLDFKETLTQDASGSVVLAGSGSTGRTTIFAIDGNNGRLFSVDDDLSDSIFSVNTIAGLPVIEAFANNGVNLGKYGAESIVISGSDGSIQLSGSIKAPTLPSTSDTVVVTYNTTTKTLGYNTVAGPSGISGLSGASGRSGLSGASGISGLSGASGRSGLSGASGISGLSGASGRSGLSGASGISGLSGASGISGLSGASGRSGLSGASGISGLSGASGASGISGLSAATAITNNTNNYVVTATGNSATPFNGEANLIFDGTNLGISTTSPQKRLDVVVSANDFSTAGAATSMGVGQWAGIHFGYRENNTNYRKSAIVFERTDNAGGGANAAGKVHILNGPAIGAGSATLSDARLTIGELGNVGIGTTSPSSQLHIAGQAELLRLAHDSAYIAFYNTANDTRTGYIQYNAGGGGNLVIMKEGGASLLLGTASTTRLAITSGGNVGIGTTSPGAKLDVNGELLVNTVRIGAKNTDSMFVGTQALNALTTGTGDTAVGYQSLLLNTGFNNTAVGAYTLYSLTTTTGNTAVGYGAAIYLQTGEYNTAVGVSALRAAAVGTRNASYNTSVGYNTGFVITTGNYNTMLGSYAGSSITTGNNNTLIGSGSGASITTGANNTIIGKYAGTSGLTSTVVLADGLGNAQLYASGSYVTINGTNIEPPFNLFVNGPAKVNDSLDVLNTMYADAILTNEPGGGLGSQTWQFGEVNDPGGLGLVTYAPVNIGGALYYLALYQFI